MHEILIEFEHKIPHNCSKDGGNCVPECVFLLHSSMGFKAGTLDQDVNIEMKSCLHF